MSSGGSSGRWSHWGASYRAAVETVGQGSVLARTLAVSDSRTLVRVSFLASAVTSGVIGHLRQERSFQELMHFTSCRRPERLEAWLGVGVDLGELRQRSGGYRLRGLRARALAQGDELLAAHYRSILEYQVGPYAQLQELLTDDPGHGRDDLDRYADDIARVSLAAAPFVTEMIRHAVVEVQPSHVLDVGCGTGIYTTVVLAADTDVEVEGVDLAPEVVTAAKLRLDEAGFGPRSQLHVGDVRQWLRTSENQFDLILLVNNIYYFDRTQRVGLYRELGGALRYRGELLVVSMTAPGSIAAAHLNFMLTCQTGSASLPGRHEVVADLVAAGYEVVDERRLVPTEPFLGVRARRIG